MMHQRKQIGLLGGTFDPIHVGHLHLALQAQERFALDEVLLCPTYISPSEHKDKPYASAKDRLQMTALALEGVGRLRVFDYEVQQATVSYTIDTVKFLHTTFPEHDYFLILGEDHFKTFMTWKHASELMRLAPLRIGSRGGLDHRSGSSLPQEHREVLEESCFKIHHLEISSTDLRERLALGLYCKHLIPPKVVDYIHQHQLYLTH